MHPSSIREIDVERDVPDLVRVIRAYNPIAVINEASFVHRHHTAPERAQGRAWVAEAGGRAIGWVESYLSLFSTSSRIGVIGIVVAEEHRGRGLGSALYEAGLAHLRSLGAERLVAGFHENDAGVAFATKRGFVEERAETESSLDPRIVTERPAAGVDLKALTDVDPRLAYEVDIEATYDMPSSEPFEGMEYDEWEKHVLRHPLLSAAGTFVALVDGQAAALSLVTADAESGRATNWMTGTRRAYRGRGLARAVKLASIHWAAANGITRMVTFNDATNAPMLAVNRRLGYQPVGRRLEVVRSTLDPS